MNRKLQAIQHHWPRITFDSFSFPAVGPVYRCLLIMYVLPVAHLISFCTQECFPNHFPNRHAECNNKGTQTVTPGITMQSLIQILKLGAMPLAASSSPALSRTERTSIVGCEYHIQSFVDPAIVRRAHSRLL